jgi:hypothetical protein
MELTRLWHAFSAEGQGAVDPQAPIYVQKMKSTRAEGYEV